MSRPTPLRWPALVLAALPLGTTAVSGQGSDPLPVEVAAVASTVSDGGELTLRLACTPLEDLSRLFALRVALTSLEDVTVDEHPLEPRTTRWRAGQTIDCELSLALPEEADLEPGEYVAVRIGFVEQGRDRARPPAGELADLADEDGLAEVLAVDVPRFFGVAGRERLEAVFAEARECKARGDTPAAWGLLEEGLRDAADGSTKERFRDALAEIGRFPPAPTSSVEEAIVAQRVRAEKVRYFRLVAGRLYDRGELHGALRLLEEAGGALAASADEKVIGALADADRVTQRIDDIREALLTRLGEDDEAEVEELVDRLGRSQALFDEAEELALEGRHPLAMALLRKLRRVNGIELYDSAQIRLDEMGEEYLAATPPTEAEAVRAALEHPAWDRTDLARSHCFLYIGPRRLVEGIPEASKLHFDLAYVFLTDLFGRRPNPEGDRVTVYFKELWDFGGGVGGGKIIDIGRAQPEPRNPVRVDTGLLYHELTHCVDDTLPIYPGFREGLANLGAAFTHEVLAQEGDALHAFEPNLEAFRKYYLERDLEYWRIQNYGPSAGFFLHFVDTYSGSGRGRHDWAPLRRFFREYRQAPIRDGRAPCVARALGHYLVRAFGPAAFDDLVAFGFPVEESDRRLLMGELEAFEGGERLGPFEEGFAEHPNSPLPRDCVERQLSRAAGRGNSEEAEELRRELGIVFDWKVVGPFFALRADPGACVFDPERLIEFAKKPWSWRSGRDARAQRVWQDPTPSWIPTRSHRNVTIFPTGWLHLDYEPYGDDNSAIYALSHITLPEAVEAVAHVRADDDFALFVNDRRIGSYRSGGSNGSTWRIQWRGPHERAPDAMRLPVRLEAGRNRVLVKLRNRYGTAGLVVAFSRPDGSRLDFTADTGEPDPPGPRPAVEEPSWRRIATVDYRSYKSKSRVAVGSFRSGRKAFHGQETGGGVGWRLFTVRPGFPKDSPSNLLWLKPTLTEDLDALELKLELDGAEAPKLLLGFQGEGGEDGLSGWSLILVPRGEGALEARLERYDRLVYQCDPVELPEVEDGRSLTLRYWDGWCSASIDGAVLFDRVSIRPIPGRHRVGLATWGPEPRIRSMVLSRGR